MTTSAPRFRLFALTLVLALAATATAGAATKTVQIKGFAFKPATIEVNRGDRVTFANGSGVTHTATGASFDTKRIAPGKSATVKFGKRGTFAYHCKIHPSMKGKVVVD
jgi:plastocyanin